MKTIQLSKKQKYVGAFSTLVLLVCGLSTGLFFAFEPIFTPENLSCTDLYFFCSFAALTFGGTIVGVYKQIITLTEVYTLDKEHISVSRHITKVYASEDLTAVTYTKHSLKFFFNGRKGFSVGRESPIVRELLLAIYEYSKNKELLDDALNLYAVLPEIENHSSRSPKTFKLSQQTYRHTVKGALSLFTLITGLLIIIGLCCFMVKAYYMSLFIILLVIFINGYYIFDLYTHLWFKESFTLSEEGIEFRGLTRRFGAWKDLVKVSGRVKFYFSDGTIIRMTTFYPFSKAALKTAYYYSGKSEIIKKTLNSRYLFSGNEIEDD